MTSTDFYLSQLDTEVSSALAAISGADPTVFTGDATVDINISLESAKSMFQFYTDSIEVLDDASTDIKYKVVYTTSATPLDIDLDTAATVSDKAIVTAAANNNLTFDYVRYLADELFSTPNGVDLFSNEETLRTTLNSNFKTAFNTVLVGLANNGEVDRDSNSPSETILSKVMLSAPSRLEDITPLAVGSNWYKAPLIAGDKLYFVLTVKADANQHNATLRSTSIGDREYLIRATLVSV